MARPTTDERTREFWKRWLARTIADQDGVVSHAQLTDALWTNSDIERALRRRELRRVHPRVYIIHTGPLTWQQRRWAAVLYAEPAALLGPVSEPRDPVEAAKPIHVAVEANRRPRGAEGIVVHRVKGLAVRTFPGKPPRLRIEDSTLLMVDIAASEHDVIGLLADVVGRRGVTAASLGRALARYPTLRRRRWVESLLADLATGACSVLEHAYLVRVERGHGLPRAERQVRRMGADGKEYRDLEYPTLGLVVELDGRLGHDSWEGQGRDADRDLDDLAFGGTETARLRWKQVVGTPCRTASRLAQILRRKGWTGSPVRCGPACEL